MAEARAFWLVELLLATEGTYCSDFRLLLLLPALVPLLIELDVIISSRCLFINKGRDSNDEGGIEEAGLEYMSD